MSNVEQIEYWNGPEGEHWVDREAQFDAMLAPFVDPHPRCRRSSHAADRVLDVGCGNGAHEPRGGCRGAVGLGRSASTSRGRCSQRARSRAAERASPTSSSSRPTRRTTRSRAEFDVVVSRFGVMFFADPVAAFTNLAVRAAPGGRLAFVCWQDLFANEWVAVPGVAMVPIVGMPEACRRRTRRGRSRSPTATGSPASSAARASPSVEIDDVHEPLLLGGGLDVDAAVAFLVEGGMGKRFLAGADARQSGAGASPR